MLLGALLNAGMPVEHLRAELSKLGLDDEFTLLVKPVTKNGVAATYFNVELTEHHEDNGHHHEHQHRHLSDIIELIDRSSLSDKIKADSKAIFNKLAAAEAKIHATDVESVHFHEVGAVDAIVDIVGFAIGAAYFAVDAVYVGAVNTGTGFVRCAHGLMPVPAPATAELLAGFKIYNNGIDRELTTPTGAAILAAMAHDAGEYFQGNFSYNKVAYGAGTQELPIPNVLRLYVASAQADLKKKSY